MSVNEMRDLLAGIQQDFQMIREAPHTIAGLEMIRHRVLSATRRMAETMQRVRAEEQMEREERVDRRSQRRQQRALMQNALRRGDGVASSLTFGTLVGGGMSVRLPDTVDHPIQDLRLMYGPGIEELLPPQSYAMVLGQNVATLAVAPDVRVCVSGGSVRLVGLGGLSVEITSLDTGLSFASQPAAPEAAPANNRAGEGDNNSNNNNQDSSSAPNNVSYQIETQSTYM